MRQIVSFMNTALQLLRAPACIRKIKSLFESQDRFGASEANVCKRFNGPRGKAVHAPLDRDRFCGNFKRFDIVVFTLVTCFATRISFNTILMRFSPEFNFSFCLTRIRTGENIWSTLYPLAKVSRGAISECRGDRRLKNTCLLVFSRAHNRPLTRNSLDQYILTLLFSIRAICNGLIS